MEQIHDFLQELLNNESKERCFMNTGSDRNELYHI